MTLCIQVCRHWRLVGEAPGLWSWSVLRVSDANLDEIGHMLSSRRVLGVKRMEVKIRFCDSNPLDTRRSCGRKLELLLKAIAKHPNLREVDFNETDFKSVHSNLLVKALLNLEEVNNLDSGQMTSQQVVELLTGIGRGGSRLKRLKLFGKNFASLDPVLLAQALTQLEELEPSWTNLTPHQWEAIFSLLGSSSKMKKVDIFDDLRFVNPQVLAAGLNSLEDVSIYFTKVTVDQVKALLTETRKLTRLKKLSLERIQLSSLKASLVSEAVQQVEEVNLATTSLTGHQIETIAAAVGESSSRLRKLRISSNSLLSVDLDLLARGVMELEEVEMVNMCMTPEQAFVVVAAIAGSSKLRRVNLELNNLSSVDPTLLAKAVCNLEEVNLGSTCLTDEQLVEICSTLKEGKARVKKLGLWRNNVSNVDNELLARALLQVSEVDLTATRLTEEQAMALFASLQNPKKLTKLKIAWNPSLWRIRNTEVMAMGLNKLDCVEMFGGVDEQGDSSLPTIVHVKSILKQSLVNSKLRKINLGKVRGGEVEEDLVKRAKEVIDKVILF